MKKTIRLNALLTGLVLRSAAAQAATSYWDINGASSGAGGATPSGTWDFGVTANWSTDSTGGVATTAWADNNDAIFSAGSDATGAFSVDLSGNRVVGNLTVEEGTITISGSSILNVGGGAGGKGIITVLPNASLTINSSVTGGDINLMLSLTGTNSANNTINGTIANGISYVRLEKRETGTWVLTGTNTYSGVTDIRAGTLVVGSLADFGVPSAIGTAALGGAHIVIGLGNNAGGVTNATLKYIGSGHSCNREIRMYGTTGPGGGTIDASGTGPLVLSGNITRPIGTESFDKTLTLTGTNTDANTISGTIFNGNNSHKTFVAKEGTGKWVLAGATTYTGDTTVNAGTLLVNDAGYINSSGAVLVNAGGTLGGTGNIFSPVTIAAGGTLSPGDSIGNLTMTSDLTLSGNLFIEVDKSLSPSNDVMTVTGVLTNAGTGTVMVANLGTALTVGDSFQIFNQPLLNGQAMSVIGGGVTWTNKLAVDGSIAVLSLAAPKVPATNLTIAPAGPTSFNLGGLGAANSAYGVYASTNITTPMTNWWLIGTTNSSGGGVIQFLDPQATNKQRFYRFGQ